MQFFKLANELITDKNITSNEFRIYTYLLSLYNADKDCAYPSLELISEKVSISIRTVKSSIKRLVELGYMTIKKRKGVNGNYNEYRDFKHLINSVKNKSEQKQEHKIKPLIVSDCKESGVQITIEEVCEYTTEHQQKISLILKQNIELTEKQMFLVGDMDLETLREAIRLFKKKRGNKFALLLNIYIDIAERNDIEVSKDIERYLKGTYIRMSAEEKETQKALKELEMYGVPYVM